MCLFFNYVVTMKSVIHYKGSTLGVLQLEVTVLCDLCQKRHGQTKRFKMYKAIFVMGQIQRL